MAGNDFEIEIKARISSRDEMKRKLKDAGATFTVSLTHEDAYYDLPPKLGSFADSDEALRIRTSRDNTTGEETCYFTYKGKKIDTTTKSRREVDMKVESGSKMATILETLGFRKVIVVKKDRRMYKHGEISITLDEVEFLDDPFIEVEIIATEADGIQAPRERLFAFLDRLGIGKERSITLSYLELIAEKLGLSRKA